MSLKGQIRILFLEMPLQAQEALLLVALVVQWVVVVVDKLKNNS
jgi:hypothetical protein